MSAFEFFFGFYGLILGLSVVEVITGLVRVFKRRQRVRIGWLTPMLALFVLLDISSFWIVAWGAMQTLEVRYGLLVIGLAIAGLYSAAASLVTPDDLEAWPDFDAFYDAHKRYVAGGLAITNLLAFEVVPLLTTDRLTDVVAARLSPDQLAWTVPYFGLLLAIGLVRDRRANMAFLALLIGFYLLQTFGL
ncbi:MAG: hypothetical protein KJ676_06890 [Alphaproteobacteria bacterium]|nr:hypothetical protein [Alphaproteobacteria bacterium]MBU1526230.1 hypothetical protein [Alphaproteobacteria bacterium]MBU2116441.1 hypothetical protein [Alphaproteobacteria bacterium]MBU2351387.1 hypothetical protein [Alphaproteobacteria bacterium]MBU2382091.1 hypothetical protein [Alphaproteobacteria bacterium]